MVWLIWPVSHRNDREKVFSSFVLPTLHFPLRVFSGFGQSEHEFDSALSYSLGLQNPLTLLQADISHISLSNCIRI
jgi:hypothetical protein